MNQLLLQVFSLTFLRSNKNSNKLAKINVRSDNSVMEEINEKCVSFDIGKKKEIWLKTLFWAQCEITEITLDRSFRCDECQKDLFYEF